MLSPEQKLLAEEISYMPLDGGEMDQQFHVDVTYNPFTRARASQKAGDVYKDKNNTLRFYWVPSGGNYPESERAALEGWYEVPTQGEVEEWLFDNAPCLTPCFDQVEPDHPDSWMTLLNLI